MTSELKTGTSNAEKSHSPANREEAYYISVIVPIYNTSSEFLGPCLESISKQTLRAHEFEIILVDDCSTDHQTVSQIDTFVSTYKNSKLVRRKENGGLNEARRSGLKVANGSYVLFVDGDDILARDGLENLRMEAESSLAELISAPMFRWDHRTKQYRILPHSSREFSEEYMTRLEQVFSGHYTFSMCGRLFARHLLNDAVFDIPKRLYHEDLVTFSRVMIACQSASQIDIPVYFYTVNQSSITNVFTKKHAQDVFWAFSDWLETVRKNQLEHALIPAMGSGFEIFVNQCVERCIDSEAIEIGEEVDVLKFIRVQFLQSALLPKQPNEIASKLMLALDEEDFEQQASVLSYVSSQYANHRRRLTMAPENEAAGITPTEMARRLKDKVVLIGQVDYQLRNAALFARELRKRGHPCVVMDNSKFASDGRRQLREDERGVFWRTEHIEIKNPPYARDWLSTAKLLVTFNDFNNDFREALEYRSQLGLPSVCVVEGINDFLRVDFESYRHLPYRRCDYVFLAGQHDKSFFQDRQTKVIGLPGVEKLLQKTVQFPQIPMAVLNVNFTYGSLEEHQDDFIETARRAFEGAQLSWQITQHPANRADLGNYPVAQCSQYEVIDQCSVFVSRFATGIIEALASGKPVIYFNPHNEHVDKFKDPLGAFLIATNEEELIAALRETLEQVSRETDFRKQANAFLKQHAAIGIDDSTAAVRFADESSRIMDHSLEQRDSVSDLFFTSLDHLWPHRHVPIGLVLGEFKREHCAQLNDEEMISHYFGDRGSIMIDVGANFGNSCDVYLGKDWTVHAFEPDPNNRSVLLETWPNHSNLIVNEQAVSNESGLEVPFFASDESTGISGLSAFTSGHKQIGHVLTTTLRDYYEKSHLTHVDFLKVDVEGFDKFVLEGFPWEKDRPDVVLAEFEDSKTLPLGYNAHDLAKMIVDLGYTVYVSEWHTIIRYGIAHDWKRLVPYSPDLDLGETWGNVIGFKDNPGIIELRKLAKRTLKFGVKSQPATAQKATGQNAPHSEPEPWYAGIAERIHARSQLAFRLFQFLLYSFRTFKRHPLVLGGGILLGIIAPLWVASQSSSSTVTLWSLGLAGLSLFILSNLLVFAFARYLYRSPPADLPKN